MAVWYDKRSLHEFHITAVRYFGRPTWRHNFIVHLVKPHVFTASNLGLLYVQYLMLYGFSCFELFKFPKSELLFINVGVSAHCVPSSTIFISHSAEVAKTQHQNSRILVSVYKEIYQIGKLISCFDYIGIVKLTLLLEMRTNSQNILA